MKVGEKEYRSIWQNEEDRSSVCVIDQRKLPFSFEVITLRSVGEVCEAISGMVVRGAPLIGATAAWGVFFSYSEHCDSSDVLSLMAEDAMKLKATRPTAVNLAWAVDIMTEEITNIIEGAGAMNAKPLSEKEVLRIKSLLEKRALDLCDEEAERSRSIGLHGLPLIEEASRRKGGDTVDIMTHCNAGWLACVDYGTALAPVYMAHDNGIKVHVWVSETRPRNQGGRLTAWELSNHGIPCTIVTDNAAGHLMQNGKVDMVIVGCDRATANGDVANKTGTYLKALAAWDNGIPFYSALPLSTFDLSVSRPGQITIEERDGDEVRKIEGLAADDAGTPAERLNAASRQEELRQAASLKAESWRAASLKAESWRKESSQEGSPQEGSPQKMSLQEESSQEGSLQEGSLQPLDSIYICQPEIPVSNFGFDVTPARLITGLITDRGVCLANRNAIRKILS